MNKNERKKILIPYMCGKNLIIDEKFINLSLLKPKDLMKNPLRVHEPLSVERKLMSGNNISLNRQMTTPKNRMIESTNKEKRA